MSYQNMLESDGISSEDTSQSHEGFQCTEKKDAGFIRARFRYFWGPLVLGLSAEILLILAVLRYEKKNWDEMLPVLQQLDLDASNLSGPGFQFVFVFVACLVGRILTLWGWRWTLCRGKDSQFGAIFMGFNCLQWLVYFWLLGLETGHPT
ncbi:RAB6A [Symbiodinium natans]|uniref:RAB6A protein n=1 Tax=Symbiodinium natans TaxID=878477 RepID=A0A812U932_9DINO|nr:RAB6A [Symbiodinium natans]